MARRSTHGRHLCITTSAHWNPAWATPSVDDRRRNTGCWLRLAVPRRMSSEDGRPSRVAAAHARCALSLSRNRRGLQPVPEAAARCSPAASASSPTGSPTFSQPELLHASSCPTLKSRQPRSTSWNRPQSMCDGMRCASSACTASSTVSYGVCWYDPVSNGRKLTPARHPALSRDPHAAAGAMHACALPYA